MTSWLLLILALICGLALGGFYFGGLWYTVARIPDTRRPAWLLVASFVARTVVVLTGFAGVMLATGARLDAAGLCLLGFILVRFVLVRRLGPLSKTAVSR